MARIRARPVRAPGLQRHARPSELLVPFCGQPSFRSWEREGCCFCFQGQTLSGLGSYPCNLCNLWFNSCLCLGQAVDLQGSDKPRMARMTRIRVRPVRRPGLQHHPWPSELLVPFCGQPSFRSREREGCCFCPQGQTLSGLGSYPCNLCNLWFNSCFCLGQAVDLQGSNKPRMARIRARPVRAPGLQQHVRLSELLVPFCG